MGSDETNNPHGGTPPINESLIIDTVRIEAERQRQEQQARDEQSRQRQARHDRAMLLITLGLLVATLITGIAALYQAHSSSLNAAAAIQAADTASDTLTKSIEQFRVDERAWIEIERIESTMVAARSANFGAAFRYRLYPKNVGKTAAHGITVSAARGMQGSIHLGSDADGMKRTQESMLLNRTLTGLPREAVDNPVPKVLAPATTAAVPFVLDGQEPQIFSKDEWVSYLIGRIDYADNFGIQHWMKFW